MRSRSETASEQRNLVDLVVNEPGRVEGVGGRDREGVLVLDIERGSVGEEAFLVGSPLVLVVGHQIPPELDVAGGHGRTVGPRRVVAELNGVGLAVLGDLGNQAQGLVEVDLVGGIGGGLVGEERTVHRLDELAVLTLRVALGGDREDPVRSTRGHGDLVLSGLRGERTVGAACGQAHGGYHGESRAGGDQPL